MTAPVRGLDFSHYMQFAVTPIARAILASGEELTPEEYYEQSQTFDSIPEDAVVHAFSFSNVPAPLGDVLVTVKSIGCYKNCTNGVLLYWEEVPEPPIGDETPWSFAPWFCPSGTAECAADDDVCRPDDCSEHTASTTVNRQEWIDNFIGEIGSHIGFPIGGCIGGSCGSRYVTITIRFLSVAATYAEDVYEQDLTFEPYHGFATWHTVICGNQAGVLSIALGEVRIDPHDGREVCYHEWAPADDADNKRYAQGGLTGIHQRPVGRIKIGDLCHGSILKQHIEGMLTRVWTDTDCVLV